MFNAPKDKTNVTKLTQSGLNLTMPMVKEHLMGMSDEDKYKRFYMPATETSIMKYLSGITLDERGDAVFVVYNGNGTKVIGMCHVAVTGVGETRSAELALSVDERYRKRNIGLEMLERALLHVETLGIKRVFMYCLSTNIPMQHMARKLGMKVFTEFDESTGSLEMAPGNITAATAEAITADNIALYDLSYRYMVNAICCAMTAFMPTQYLPKNEKNKEV